MANIKQFYVSFDNGKTIIYNKKSQFLNQTVFVEIKSIYHNASTFPNYFELRSTTKLNLNLKTAQLSTVIKEIEKQSGLTFFYHIEDINLDQKITVTAQNKSLAEVLNTILNQTKLNWKIEKKTDLYFLKTFRPVNNRERDSTT